MEVDQKAAKPMFCFGAFPVPAAFSTKGNFFRHSSGPREEKIESTSLNISDMTSNVRNVLE